MCKSVYCVPASMGLELRHRLHLSLSQEYSIHVPVLSLSFNFYATQECRSKAESLEARLHARECPPVSLSVSFALSQFKLKLS